MAELYRTKEDYHVVEANQLTSENALVLSAWCEGVLVKEHDALQHDITFSAINVPTPEGMKRAQEGNWIVRTIQGHFYSVTQFEFDLIYEAVVDG